MGRLIVVYCLGRIISPFSENIFFGVMCPRPPQVKRTKRKKRDIHQFEQNYEKPNYKIIFFLKETGAIPLKKSEDHAKSKNAFLVPSTKNKIDIVLSIKLQLFSIGYSYTDGERIKWKE